GGWAGPGGALRREAVRLGWRIYGERWGLHLRAGGRGACAARRQRLRPRHHPGAAARRRGGLRPAAARLPARYRDAGGLRAGAGGVAGAAIRSLTATAAVYQLNEQE